MQVIKHFLVHWSYDSHHAIFGVFSNLERFKTVFEEQDDITKARLWSRYTVDEYSEDDCCDPIDSIQVEEIIDYDSLSDSVKAILEKDG